MAEADRIRLLARTAANYDPYDYAPILADDMKAVAAVGYDTEAASALAILNAATCTSLSAAAAADRVAAAGSATLAAALSGTQTSRVVGQRLNDVSQWALTRSTPSWSFNALGLLEESSINTAGWAFDFNTLAPLGLNFAVARTNNITNPRAEGAVTGIPGTVPTGWGTRPSGVPNMEIVSPGITTRRGVPGVLVRFWGVPTSTAGQTWALSASVAHTTGQVLCASTFVELVAGTLTNVGSFSFRASTANDPGAVFTPGAFARVGRAWTSTANPSIPGLRWQYTDTVTAVDFTLFIGGMSLEVNVPFVSPPIFPAVTVPGVSTRALTNVDIPVKNFGVNYNYRSGTVIVDWNSFSGSFTSGADTDFMCLFSLGDLSANEVMGLLINPAHTSVVFRRTIAGIPNATASVTITAPIANQTIVSAFSWDITTGFMQVASRGVVGTKLTGETSIPNISHAMLGRFSTTRAFTGSIAGIEIRPTATFDAALASLT